VFQRSNHNQPDSNTGSCPGWWMFNVSDVRRSYWMAALLLAGLLQIASSETTLAQQAATNVEQAAKVAEDKKQVAAQGAVATDEHNAETIDLLTEDLTKHWRVFNSSPPMPDAPVWKVIREGSGDEQELILVCSGEPKGFLYTTESCSEFELTLEWKYPSDADGNSGVLVYAQDEPRIWPTSMQIQLHQPKAGSVFPSGDAISDPTSEVELDLARPVDVWNEGKIVSRGGRLSVEVNSKKGGEVSGAKPCSGSIALQSEGSVVHFRRIRLRKLPPTAPVEKIEPSVSAANGVERFRTTMSHTSLLTRRQNDRHRIAAIDVCERAMRKQPAMSRQRRNHVQ
jgi:hypothetical protein